MVVQHLCGVLPFHLPAFWGKTPRLGSSENGGIDHTIVLQILLTVGTYEEPNSVTFLSGWELIMV